uniref:Protein zer-1 homolog-like C-terminal domain-containing protein n=1 Tax=Strigamia maritima TaxID=126957 RepID=T1JAD3_STRMM
MDNLEIVTAILFLIILYLLFLDKQKEEKFLKAKIDEREIVEVFQDIDATPEDIYQSISTLGRLAQDFQRPRPDLINLVLNVMTKNNSNTLIQHQALKCLNRFKKKLHPISDQKLCLQIVNITLNAMEKFPTDIKIQKMCLSLLWNTKDIPFDKWLCLKLLLNMLSILEEDTETLNTLRVCDNIFYSIPFDQRDIYADISDNWKQTWAWNLDEGELCTLRKTLSVLWNICSLPSRRDETIFFDLQFFTDALRTFADDHVTQEGILGILHNISCKKQFGFCFLTPDLMMRFQNAFLSENFRLSFAASKVIVKLVYYIEEPWPETGTSRKKVLEGIKEKINSGWNSTDFEILMNASFDFNCIELLQCEVPELQLYGAWFIYNLCSWKKSCDKFEKCGLLKIVKEKATVQNDVGNYCRKILACCGDI